MFVFSLLIFRCIKKAELFLSDVKYNGYLHRWLCSLWAAILTVQYYVIQRVMPAMPA